MPYSGASDKSLPEMVKGMPMKKKKQWVAVWNSAYSSCIDGGGSKKSCETKAFKEANGVVSQTKETSMSRNMLKDLWNGLIDSLNQEVSKTTEEVDRAISFLRLRDQLWEAIDCSEEVSQNGWAYPIDIFYGDKGEVFSIVTQGGKIYQVPLTVEQESVTLGTWQQVTEVFQPVSQTKNSFTIKRQKNGKYRWLFVAATSVINRVGEIDSTTLFDSFVEDAEKTGDYPRVDFYHLGASDPKTWEFGTADYLAREKYCYITSGTFDEDHPLAKATIRAYEKDPEKWGCSIEFYAIGSPEVIVLDPQVQVPVYKEGKNTRISIVKECDAAGLFTRVASITEEKVRMKRDIIEVLTELFGDDTEALDKFAENVDSINRTIQTDGLVSRTKKAKVEAAKAAKADETEEEDDEDEDIEDEEDTEDGEDDSTPIELDDEAISQMAKQFEKSDTMTAIQQSLEKLQASIDSLTSGQVKIAEEVAATKKAAAKQETRLKSLERDDAEKLQEKVEDLPSRRTRKANYQRPRDRQPEDLEEDTDDLESVAKRTLSKLPSYN